MPIANSNTMNKMRTVRKVNARGGAWGFFLCAGRRETFLWSLGRMAFSRAFRSGQPEDGIEAALALYIPFCPSQI